MRGQILYSPGPLPFKDDVNGLGLRQLVTAYKAPVQNVHAERVTGTIRGDRLDTMIVMGEGPARCLREAYVRH